MTALNSNKGSILRILTICAALALSPIIGGTIAFAQTDDSGQTRELTVPELLRRAEQGEAAVQHNLGVAYNTGEGVTQDHSKAAQWYRKAADQGFAGAQFNLGILYSRGNGVTQNLERAVYWWRKAADQGHTNSQRNLGIAYAVGDGVTEDPVEAYKWFIIAGDDELQGMIIDSLSRKQKQQASAMAWSWGEKAR